MRHILAILRFKISIFVTLLFIISEIEQECERAFLGRRGTDHRCFAHLTIVPGLEVITPPRELNKVVVDTLMLKEQSLIAPKRCCDWASQHHASDELTTCAGKFMNRA